MTYTEYLTQHGISETTANEFGLTLVNSEKYGEQIAFPIKDTEGNFLYNKYRNLASSKENDIPKFIYDAGATAKLYNSHNIKNFEYVFIFEGEPDVWLASQDGMSAVCSTSGAGTFETDWAEGLSGKKILICYDNDTAGVEGVNKVQEYLPDALVIKLPEGIKDYCEYRQKHTVAEFKDIVLNLIKENTLTYNEFGEVIDKWLLLPDKNVLRIIFATLISHYFTTDPLWLFLVAPPSGTKTELITLLSALPIVYMMSDLTTKTLFSGLEGKRKTSPSLMMRIPNSIITMKDFTTVLSMRAEDKQIILGQLREIYDGKYDKPFGTGEEVHWKGRITLITGVTGIIDDQQQTVLRVMGERFVMYRILQPNDEEVAIKALSTSGQETEMRAELKAAMKKYFWGVKIPKISDITIPSEIINSLATLSSFIVIARSGIIRNSYGAREITLIPEPEAPSRLAKQLGVLVRSLAVLDKRKEVTWNDYYLALRVALDSIPRSKLIHLLTLADNNAKTADVALKTGYSYSGSEIMLEDLFALKLIQKEGWGAGVTAYWKLSDKALGYLKKILPIKDESILKYFIEGDVYLPFVRKCQSLLENVV